MNGDLDKFSFFKDYVFQYGYSGKLFQKAGLKSEAKRFHDIADRFFLHHFMVTFVNGALDGKDEEAFFNEVQNEASAYVAEDKVRVAGRGWTEMLQWQKQLRDVKDLRENVNNAIHLQKSLTGKIQNLTQQAIG